MIYNVCRPITLYNDFLPPANKPHTDWDYLAFGYFDGIKVGRNLFTDGKCSMECIWKYDMEQMKMLQGTYSEQTIYGFRAKDDTDFWRDAKNEDAEYPFLFVIMLQGKTNRCLADISNRIDIEKDLSKSGRIKVITYLTLDNSSMLILLLCRNYASGSSLVDSFHRGDGQKILRNLGVELSYSYTVAAVQKKIVEGDGIQKLENEIIKNVYIYGIERYPNSIKTVYERIKNLLCVGKISLIRKESVLGCNDEVIVLKNVPWSDFLMLYRDELGILNHSSEEYNLHLLGVTTILTENQEGKNFEDKCLCKEEKFERNQEMDASSDSDMMSESISQLTLLQNMRTRIKTNDDRSFSAEAPYLKRYLYQVINALQKFERPSILDYVFQSMFLPIDMVLDIVSHHEEGAGQDFIGSFHEFVKGLNLCVQNSIRSDRQFTQSLDFNIQIYNTPVRLNAFYNAFIYFIKSFLQCFDKILTNKHRYEFLASVGVTNKIQVYELFKNLSERNRLFLVSIPENQIYDMQSMLFVLSHEVAHFVGASVRNREYRYKCVITITAQITSTFFRLKLKEKYKKFNGQFVCEEDYQYWDRFERLMENYLTEYLEQLRVVDHFLNANGKDEKEREVDKTKKLYKKYKEYTHVFRELLVDEVSDILQDKRDELFGYLQEKEYLSYLCKGESVAREKREKMLMCIGEVSKELTGYSVWETATHLSLVRAVDRMIVFFKECEADLVDILTLELSLKDYLWAIKKSILEQGREDKLYSAEIIIRSGLVTCCLFYRDEAKSLGYGWTDEQLEEVGDLNDSDLKKMQANILDFERSFFDEANIKKREIKEPSKAMDIFTYPKVLEPLLSYLLKCRETFESNLHDIERPDYVRGMMENLQGKLQEMYSLCRETDIEKLIWKMQEYIEDYKAHLDKEISDILKKRIEEKDAGKRKE